MPIKYPNPPENVYIFNPFDLSYLLVYDKNNPGNIMSLIAINEHLFNQK